MALGATDKRREGDQPRVVHVRLRRAERNRYRTFSGARSWEAMLADAVIRED
jgi:hypothetical protein